MRARIHLQHHIKIRAVNLTCLHQEFTGHLTLQLGESCPSQTLTDGLAGKASNCASADEGGIRWPSLGGPFDSDGRQGCCDGSAGEWWTPWAILG